MGSSLLRLATRMTTRPADPAHLANRANSCRTASAKRVLVSGGRERLSGEQGDCGRVVQIHVGGPHGYDRPVPATRSCSNAAPRESGRPRRGGEPAPAHCWFAPVSLAALRAAHSPNRLTHPRGEGVANPRSYRLSSPTTNSRCTALTSRGGSWDSSSHRPARARVRARDERPVRQVSSFSVFHSPTRCAAAWACASDTPRHTPRHTPRKRPVMDEVPLGRRHHTPAPSSFTIATCVLVSSEELDPG